MIIVGTPGPWNGLTFVFFSSERWSTFVCSSYPAYPAYPSYLTYRQELLYV
jgi:hypothetical protein